MVMARKSIALAVMSLWKTVSVTTPKGSHQAHTMKSARSATGKATLKGKMKMSEKIQPGTYENQNKDPRPAWTEFTLYPNGQVTFVDAVDGHVSYYSVNQPDGNSWLEWAGKQLKSGQLKKVR